jgi:hypothetical protein
VFTLPGFLPVSQKGCATILFGFIVLLPTGFVAAALLPHAGPEVAGAVALGVPLAAMVFYSWRLRVSMASVRYDFYDDRVESRGLTNKLFFPTPTHEVLRYAAVGHVGLTKLGYISLRHGPGSANASQELLITVSPEHREGLVAQLAEWMRRADPEALFSMRESTDGPTEYSLHGDPLVLLMPHQTVHGVFRFENTVEAHIWDVVDVHSGERLVRVRREMPPHRTTEDDSGHWLVETPDGFMLAYLHSYMNVPSGRHYDVRGARGIELGRLKVSMNRAELVTGNRTLRVANRDDALRFELDGVEVGQVERRLVEGPGEGALLEELPTLTFALAAACTVLV